MGVVQEIHRISREAADASGGGRLTSVTVAVGELSAIEPSLLAFAWDAITAGGPDAGSRLEDMPDAERALAAVVAHTMDLDEGIDGAPEA
jgi:Zn finger protein HypA/HybF involved in hydrogenase expression